MGSNEIATKADLEKLKAEILAAIQRQSKPAEPKVISFDDACTYLGGMKAGTLRSKCSQGEIAFTKAGKYPVFYKADLDRYLERNRHRSNEELRNI